MSSQTADGLTYTALSNADRFFNLQPIRIVVSPKRKGADHYHHEGEEWLYVLSGRLALSLDGKMYELEAGDAAHFDSRRPHRLIARGPQSAEVLLVASPHSGPERRAFPLADQKAAPFPPPVFTPNAFTNKPPKPQGTHDNRTQGKHHDEPSARGLS